MFNIPLELVLTLGPVLVTATVLTLIDATGLHISGSASRAGTYFNRNANWPLPALDDAASARRLAARIGLARTARP